MTSLLRRVELATCGDCRYLKRAWGGEFGCRHSDVMRNATVRAVREYTDEAEWFAPLSDVTLNQCDHQSCDGPEATRLPRVHPNCPFLR